MEGLPKELKQQKSKKESETSNQTKDMQSKKEGKEIQRVTKGSAKEKQRGILKPFYLVPFMLDNIALAMNSATAQEVDLFRFFVTSP